MPLLSELKRELKKYANPERRRVSMRYFKTGPGQYGAGDQFIGVAVPHQRAVARAFASLSLSEVWKLLASPIHEERLTAVFILVRQFQRGNPAIRTAIYKRYIKSARYVNNWDIVDSSAPQIIGGYLLGRSASERQCVLDKLVRSKNIWERRMAVLATSVFIRKGDCQDIFRMAKVLLADQHDLMHKAFGWMLREVGDHCGQDKLEKFLRAHLDRLPRTALRYAIEHLPPTKRKHYLKK